MAAEAQSSGVRRAEVIAALSLATDLAVGQSMEFALRACVLTVRLGEAMGLSADELGDAYWYSLLRYVGCNAEAHTWAALIGNEVAFNGKVAEIDMARPGELMPLVLGMIREANAGGGTASMVRAMVLGLASSRSVAVAVTSSHCDVAERLAKRLGFDERVVATVGFNQERWDGKGLPKGLKGEAVARAARVANFARDVVVLAAAFGEEGAAARVKARRGGAYDPRIVDAFLARRETLTASLGLLSGWSAVLDLEPEPRHRLSEAEIDEACIAMGDFVDVKAPWFSGHSRAVGALAGEAARKLGLPAAEAVEARRAGYLHDLGMAPVSAGLLMKEGELSAAEREQIRLHPHYGERILARSPFFERLGAIVGAHHERLDGSGYHRGLRGAPHSPQAAVLAAAEAYQAMRESRAHRPALSEERASGELRLAVREGALDGAAVNAVLAVAGHRVSQVRQDQIAGLTEREVEVLRLVAAGRSMKEIGRVLGISPKTVDNHLQHLYPKIGVRTRAGAALFAVERGLNREITTS